MLDDLAVKGWLNHDRDNGANSGHLLVDKYVYILLKPYIKETKCAV